MKILHIVEDFSVSSGGLRTVIKNLDFYLKSLGNESYILSSDQEKGDDIFLVKCANKWLYSKEWKRQINSIINRKKIDIIHIHGVWLYPQLIGAKIANQKNIPMVLSLHGMYQPWLWKKGTFKKKLYFYLLSKRQFSKASIIHTITANESKNIKHYFKKNQCVEIPNLITFKENTLSFTENNQKYILYLGRLNKTKGIDVLINAFSEIENKNTTLKIAGEYSSYKKELDALVTSLKLTKKIEFLGMVKGDEKEKLIKNSWVMASPTHSDVIGMVNLEAASLKTPMITTHKTGLNKNWNTNGGRLINPNVKELKAALEETLNWSLEERVVQGELLYKFVKKEYSWKNRLKDWESLYKKAIVNEK